MKTIPLTQGKFTLVDDSDYEWLSGMKWSLARGVYKEYAVSTTWKDNKTTAFYMHRFIFGDAAPGKEVDHIDGDGLNNQRDNLRLCYHYQNNCNRKIQSNQRYQYKGIQQVGKKWRALIYHSGRLIHLGMYLTDKEAAIAYDENASKLFGEYAKLNFPVK